MSSYKSRASDRRAANDAVAGQELMCAATGCPHRWSVDAGAGRLCSWHAWSDPHYWPQITQERLDAVADKARDQCRDRPATKALSRAEKTAILTSLRNVLKPRQGRKDWAQRILDRSRDGEHISQLVLKMARDALLRVAARGKEQTEEA